MNNMLIPWYWLLITVIISSMTGLLAIFLTRLWLLECQTKMDTLKRDVDQNHKDTSHFDKTLTGTLSTITDMTKKIQDCEILAHGTRSLIEANDESIRNLSNKLAARDRTERRAIKREEVDKNSKNGQEEIDFAAAGAIPLDRDFGSGGDYKSYSPRNYQGQTAPFGTIP